MRDIFKVLEQIKEIEELKMKLELEKIDNKYNKEEAYEEMIPRYKIKAILKKYGKKEIEYAPDFYKEIQSLLEEE